MDCLICEKQTQSLRRNIACCRGCRSELDEKRKAFEGNLMDILTGKMSVADFEEQNPKTVDMSDVIVEDTPE